jgi:AMMECR1 domain-containing protein
LEPALSVGTISDRRAAGLVRLARSTLADVAGQEAGQPDRSGPGQVLVNVTVYVRQRLQACMSGSGEALEDAVRDAAACAAADVRSGRPLAADDLPDARVELWIQTASEVIDRADDIAMHIDLGLDGIAIRVDGRSAHYAPSVALTSGIARHDLLFDKLTKEAGLSPGAWRDPRITLHRTSWKHYCELPADPGQVLHLRRLRPASLEALTTAELRARARLAADRLVAVQSAEGYYLYTFHPFNGREKPGPGNFVRQAGCAYAMARAADSAESPERRRLLASSACRVIDVLLSRVVTEAGTVFIADLPKAGQPVWGKLGTIALTLAAIQSPSLTSRYQTERPRLVEAILAFQRPDGSFRCRTDSTSVSDDGTSQDYFPGEALLSLAVEVRAGSVQAERAMAAALPWYRARFRAQPTTAFILWQLDAWRTHATWLIDLERPAAPDTRACCEFIYEMADWLLQFQVGRSASHPDLIGGFARPGRSPGNSSAAYTEAIIRAFGIAERLEDRSRADRYRQASLGGLDFVRRLQVMPDTGVLFGDPARAVGGTTASLSDMTIRCDYDQHALTAYLAALETSSLLKA